jgi:cell division protein FtsI/penicillin-binding protein 2
MPIKRPAKRIAPKILDKMKIKSVVKKRSLKEILDELQTLTQTLTKPNPELQKAIERYGAKAGSVIVMDPKTGAIFAMGAYPSFDPNFFRIEKSAGVFSNPLVYKSCYLTAFISVHY